MNHGPKRGLDPNTAPKLFICPYCKAEVISFYFLKEHQRVRCRALQAIRRKRERIQREHLAQDRQGTLKEWGLR